jgi:hypothetical protein
MTTGEANSSASARALKRSLVRPSFSLSDRGYSWWMSFWMLAGGIDLWSGATAGLAAVVAGLLFADAGWPEGPST